MSYWSEQGKKRSHVSKKSERADSSEYKDSSGIFKRRNKENKGRNSRDFG